MENLPSWTFESLLQVYYLYRCLSMSGSPKYHAEIEGNKLLPREVLAGNAGLNFEKEKKKAEKREDVPTELTKSVVIDEKLLLYPLGYFSEGQVAYNEEWDKIAGLFRFRWKALKGSSRSQLLSLPHKPKRWFRSGRSHKSRRAPKKRLFSLSRLLGRRPKPIRY